MSEQVEHVPSTILIITDTLDIHADAVILELNRREVPVFRFHPEDFPQKCHISLEPRDGHIDGEIANMHHHVRLKDIRATWYRRPGKPQFDVDAQSDILEYLVTQANDTIRNLYEILDSFDSLWVGNPKKLRVAEIKSKQLIEANKVGLKTLPTLISNDPQRAALFIDGLGEAECAIKPLSVVGVSDEEGYRFPLTQKLPRGYVLNSVELAPNIFQPYVDKAADLRCVVFDEKIFCAKLLSQADEKTRLDWRSGDCQHEIFPLPNKVQIAIRRLMKRFDINFASLDLMLTRDDEFIFLDLNPNGQWLWLEFELGFPLVASMADLLTKSRVRKRKKI